MQVMTGAESIDRQADTTETTLRIPKSILSEAMNKLRDAVAHDVGFFTVKVKDTDFLLQVYGNHREEFCFKGIPLKNRHLGDVYIPLHEKVTGRGFSFNLNSDGFFTVPPRLTPILSRIRADETGIDGTVPVRSLGIENMSKLICTAFEEYCRNEASEYAPKMVTLSDPVALSQLNAWAQNFKDTYRSLDYIFSLGKKLPDSSLKVQYHITPQEGDLVIESMLYPPFASVEEKHNHDHSFESCRIVVKRNDQGIYCEASGQACDFNESCTAIYIRNLNKSIVHMEILALTQSTACHSL